MKKPIFDNTKKKIESIEELKQKYPKIPPLKDGDIRIIILGGVEEVGRNMSAIEYKDSIILVDCGFLFSNPDLPGVDYILPNIEYLVERKEKIKGLFVTHGHLDHVGGIPYCLDRLNYPPIYSRRLTNAIIKLRQEEFPKLKPLTFNEVEKDSIIKITDELSIRFFAVTHTIPDSMGIIIETPQGDVVFTGDLKLDHNNGVVTEEEAKEFDIFKKRNVLCALADSTNSQNPGFSLPERRVSETLEELIKTIKGRIIIGAFASQLERSIKMIQLAEKYGKKVVIEGRSMKTNLGLAMELGLLKVNKNTLITPENISDYPDDKIIVIATGSQGEHFAALGRISREQHRYIKLQTHDTIILSSSVVPGNEVAVQNMKALLSKLGATLITYQVSEVHSSGHANREELKWIHEHIKEKNFIPVHGMHFMLKTHTEILKEVGLKDENIIIPENGSIIEIRDEGKTFIKLKEKAPDFLTTVDGNNIGLCREALISERKILGSDGMIVLIILINNRTRKLKKRADIISRGFVYLRDSQTLLHDVRSNVKTITEEAISGSEIINIETLKKKIKKGVASKLVHKTNKRPIIIPTIFIL